MYFSFCFCNSGFRCLLFTPKRILYFVNVVSLGLVWAKYLKSTCELKSRMCSPALQLPKLGENVGPVTKVSGQCQR